MNDPTIYVIIGCTGAHDDRDEWTVYWAPTEEEAARYQKILESEYNNALKGEKPDKVYWDSFLRGALDRHMRRYDPFFKFDYTGTYWHIVPVTRVPSTH